MTLYIIGILALYLLVGVIAAAFCEGRGWDDGDMMVPIIFLWPFMAVAVALSWLIATLLDLLAALEPYQRLVNLFAPKAGLPKATVKERKSNDGI